jgi:hypothetical protein
MFSRLFCVVAFTVMLSSFVAANGASNRSAGGAMMTCVVAGGSADNSSLETALGARGAGHGCHGKS